MRGLAGGTVAALYFVGSLLQTLRTMILRSRSLPRGVALLTPGKNRWTIALSDSIFLKFWRLKGAKWMVSTITQERPAWSAMKKLIIDAWTVKCIYASWAHVAIRTVLKNFTRNPILVQRSIHVRRNTSPDPSNLFFRLPDAVKSKKFARSSSRIHFLHDFVAKKAP